MISEQEQWKPIAGFEGYKVSSFGNVKSVERLVWNGKGYVHKPEMILKQARSHKGYPIVYLSHNNRQKTVPVHRLVASAFIPNPFGKPQVNHINGIKTDNRVTNLEWCTQEHNMEHAFRTGLEKPSERQKRAVCETNKAKRKAVIAKHGTTQQTFESIAKASAETGLSASTISRYCNGIRQSCNGIEWAFVEDTKV